MVQPQARRVSPIRLTVGYVPATPALPGLVPTLTLIWLPSPVTGPYDTLLAGMLGGYLVFGGRSRRTGKISSVNQQIVIYVFARVVLALARLAVKPGSGLPLASEPGPSAAISHHAWPVFAAASWGMVMHLFRWHAAELQPSLRSSMSYIYAQSDEWDGLRTFLWHNK